MSALTNDECPLFTDTSSYIPFSTSFGVDECPLFTDTSTYIPFPTSFGVDECPSFGVEAPAFSFGNPFASATQPSQPAFKITIFDFLKSPFGASSQPAFGSTEASAFDATNPFETGSSGFTQTNTFESATQPSQPDLEISGASSQPAFGSTEAPADGATSTPAFGATSASAFDATNPFKTGLPLPTRFELTKDPLEHYSHHFERSNTNRTEAIYYLR